MTHTYLYYRIDPAQADLAASRIDLLLGAMARFCSPPPRRLSRCEDPLMWMELYEGITDSTAFTTALNLAVETFNCAEFTLGERNLEFFCDPSDHD